MATFTVWKFDDTEGAGQIAEAVLAAQADGLVKVIDHAVVTWPVGAEHPDTKHSHDSTARGAGWGALWGVLGGALFLVPIVGGLVGAGIGALSKATEGAGITKDDLETIRTQITEGTSAIFLVTENADFDRLGERLHGMNKTLIHTNLTDEERSIMLETFGG